jgi:type IV secretory pathway VirD2 relaxase
MARVVRHRGARFRAAPLARHISYLERDGVTRDGRDASMFDASGDAADRDAFAARCEDDRHHFRLIVSPEDAADLGDLRTFTRDLMSDMAKDLDSRLDWVAVDHWNTDNPHVHILVRGVADDGADLVIDRGYIAAGNPRACRSARDARARSPQRARHSDFACARGRCRALDEPRCPGCNGWPMRRAGQSISVPPLVTIGRMHGLLVGRAAKLEAMGLAERTGAGRWSIEAGAEQALREVATRGDIIKTMHRGARPRRRALRSPLRSRSTTGHLMARSSADWSNAVFMTSCRAVPMRSSTAPTGAPIISAFATWT